MGLFETQSAAEALQDLLEKERAAILRGRFDSLERLAAEKERLVKAVVQLGREGTSLAGLKAQAERNRALLMAMGSGVKAAIRRIEGLRGVGAPLQTYDAAGHRTAIAQPQRTLGRRA